MLRGAVLGLQDGGDDNSAAEAVSESMEEALGEKQPTEDQTDNGQEFQSPWKQVQRQHLHLMVELLRPQDDIRLVRGPAELVSIEEQYYEIRGHPGNWRGDYPNPKNSAISARGILTGQELIFLQRTVKDKGALSCMTQEMGVHEGGFC